MSGKKNDPAKLTFVGNGLTFVGNVEEELASEPASALMFMGARYEPSSGRQHIEILFKKDVLASLDMNQKAQLVEALQKAAEYITASIGGSGASGVS